MGKRGPQPLPANVLKLRGSGAYAAKRDGAGVIEPEIEIPSCPKFLLPLAKKEWKRISPELEKLGLISNIDATALALYCQERAWWEHHDTAYQKDIADAAERRAAWEADPGNHGKPWTGGDGHMLPTPNGGFTYNPHWVARQRHIIYVNQFLANFGMSPSARGRVQASSRQMTLPGVEPKDGFNAI